MQLVIVESPTKARTLSRFLGEAFDVEATMGHIKDLPKSKLGVDIEGGFAPDYVVIPKRKETIEKLKVKSQKSKVIYLATDPDREGEAIAKHVEEILRSKSKIKNQKSKILRIVFHEITQEAVEEAIKNPRDIDVNLVDAQTSRRVLDRLVGYKLSPLLWKKVRRGLSAGRVQSVAVRLIVEREKEIEAFQAEEYWEVYAKLKNSKNQKLQAMLVNQKIENKETADGILKDLEKANYKVLDVKKREVIKNPYPPFTTSTMTQAGARIFGWSSKRTMLIAQKLYEDGLITYHRTDSTNIASIAVQKVRQFIRLKYGERYLPENPRFYKTKSKVAQEAHEAIRPTDVNNQSPITNHQTPDAKRLYDLIWKRFVACQMAASIYDETVVDVEARSPTRRVQARFTPRVHYLRATGQVMKFDGWKRLFDATVSDEIRLPEVQKGEVLDLIKVWGEQKFTQPPARYNEAMLIKTLEKLGIGRPSTYAPIISTIQVRQYVEKVEGRFTPTPVGVAVNDFLVANFTDVFDYKFTAKMEDELDSVANGKLPWVKTIKDFYDPFAQKLNDVEKNSKRVKIEVEKLGKKCPECKIGELVIRTGRFGKFISCSRFPECKYTEKYIEKIGLKCPDCKDGDVVIKKSKRGRKFFGCSRYPDCKWASWRKPTAT